MLPLCGIAAECSCITLSSALLDVVKSRLVHEFGVIISPRRGPVCVSSSATSCPLASALPCTPPLCHALLCEVASRSEVTHQAMLPLATTSRVFQTPREAAMRHHRVDCMARVMVNSHRLSHLVLSVHKWCIGSIIAVWCVHGRCCVNIVTTCCSYHTLGSVYTTNISVVVRAP